jgi:hypothetical protein
VDGRIQRALDREDDDSAIERATQLVDGLDVELWQYDRKIALFDRKPSSR